MQGKIKKYYYNCFLHHRLICMISFENKWQKNFANEFFKSNYANNFTFFLTRRENKEIYPTVFQQYVEKTNNIFSCIIHVPQFSKIMLDICSRKKAGTNIFFAVIYSIQDCSPWSLFTLLFKELNEKRFFFSNEENEGMQCSLAFACVLFLMIHGLVTPLPYFKNREGLDTQNRISRY